MNNVKKFFSIRDLENLSGIKAHTIRIWEKRYNLLKPERTSTNIRTYSLTSLQKLLNITLLYNSGYKISKIAKIPEAEIPSLVREIVAKNSSKKHSLNAFKLAMINFNQSMFLKTYDQLSKVKSFRDIFKEDFIPLLNELGLLWQTNSISPAHEHFITSLIKQKLVAATESLQYQEPSKTDKVFVPFLPENEIHELGLLFINYEIVLKGYKSIYLGQSMPLDTLKDVLDYFDKVCFLSYFTVSPNKDKIEKYIADFTKMVKNYETAELWILGQQTRHLEQENTADFIKIFNSIDKITAEF